MIYASMIWIANNSDSQRLGVFSKPKGVDEKIVYNCTGLATMHHCDVILHAVLKKEDGKLFRESESGLLMQAQGGDIKLLTKWHHDGPLLLDQFLQKSTCILLKSENLMWGLRVSHLYHLYNMAIWMLEFLSKNKVKAFQLQLKGFSYCWTHILLLISLFYGS